MKTAFSTTEEHNKSSPLFSAMTEADTQECASFLLTLKHRSVTPEPIDDVLDTTHVPQSNHTFKSIFLKRTAYDSDDSSLQEPSLQEEEDEQLQICMPSLMVDTALVKKEDRELVPDALFLAMAQMQPCQLTEADRVGCYKEREVGFTGMCCKHCGGQPGFGKYFPATLRSLAQTTTSQTILKHVAQRCRFCPPEIREAIAKLQKENVVSPKHSPGNGRPRYGSRKVFFQRIWNRLHENDQDTTVEQERALSPPTLDLTSSQPYQEEITIARKQRKRKTASHRRSAPKKSRSNMEDAQ
eukprot:CAMPEP_0195290928 /NCGR_PEP_ID=MMETSP0707-20130614/6592_1 /TAXON_ID=33640 /ORGANISM="Asterionellopsis glacialis, Strain CCMP134" /LENGTH=297 /DNA_ID=CAMNT_0040351111 /DNA_START=75 /DNA_END=968 /DNA_ORIENTATION=-